MKNYKLFVIAVILIFISCKSDAPVSDFRFTPSITVISGELYDNASSQVQETYRNMPIVLSVSITGKDAEQADYSIQYYFSPGEGEITVNGSTLQANTNVGHNFKDGNFNFNLTPTGTGECNLVLTISNGSVTESLSFKIFIREPSYLVAFEDLPSNMYIEKKFSFLLDVQEVREDNTNQGTVNTYGKVTRGSGDLYISDQVIVENGVPSKINIGSNNISYFARELGENTITFEIEDKYGNYLQFPVNLSISKPDFKIKLIEDDDSSPAINTDYSFKVNIDNDTHDNNNFKISYRFIFGSGSVKVNGSNIEPGTQVNGIVGDNIFVLNTPNIGDLELEINIQDKYNTSKSVLLSGDVAQNPIRTSITQNSETVMAGNTATFSASVTKDSYDGKFYVVHTVVKGAGELVINNSSILTEGTRYQINSGANGFRYTPYSAGDNELLLVFSDDNGQESRQTVKYNVTLPELNIDIKPVSTTAVVNNPYNFTITIESESGGNFISTYTLLTGNGVLRNGSTVIAPGANFSLNKGINNLNFTPSTTSSSRLSFNIGDEHGQSKGGSIDVNPSLPDFGGSLSNVTNTIKVGQPASMTINVETLDNNPAQVMFSLEKGNGSFILNGRAAATGTLIDINSGPNSVLFTPADVGENELKFLLRDTHGREIPLTASIKSEPNELIVDINKQEDEITIDEYTTFTANVSESSYEGKFYCSYRYITGEGTLTVNGSSRTEGTRFEVQRGTNSFRYTPRLVTNTEIELLFTDENGQEITKNVFYTITPGKIIVNIEKFSENIMVLEQGSFEMAISQTGYSGSYSLSCIGSEGTATFNVRGQSYSMNGNWITNVSNLEIITVNPTTVGPLSFRMRVRDSNNNQSDVIIVEYNVVPQPEIEITTSSISSTLINRSVSFNVSTKKEGHSGYFTATYILVNGAGTLAINGTNTVQNSQFNLSSEYASGFVYTPTIQGKHTIQLQVTDGKSQKALSIDIDCQVTISATSNVNGATITGTGNKTVGTTSSLIATHPEHKFQGWYENNVKVSDASTYSFTVSKDRTLTAMFTPQVGTGDWDHFDNGKIPLGNSGK